MPYRANVHPEKYLTGHAEIDDPPKVQNLEVVLATPFANIDWPEICRRVSKAEGPVAWCWAALRDHQSAWEVVALSVDEKSQIQAIDPGELLHGRCQRSSSRARIGQP